MACASNDKIQESVKDDHIHESVKELARQLKHGDIKGTYDIVTSTVSVLKDLISKEEWSTARKLMDIIVLNGKYLIAAAPLEECIGNMVRRILCIIREEYSELKNKMISESKVSELSISELTISETKCKTDETVSQEASSLRNILTCDDEEDSDFNMTIPSLKSTLIQDISEFESELEVCRENIVNQAPEHFHNQEVILTLGRSRLVEQFLMKAAESRPIEVFVSEGHPSLSGHELAANLGDAGIKVTLITDSHIYAVMPMITKCIIGTQTVFADGGMRAICCSRIVAESAKRYGKPVYVLLPLYKLSPRYLNPSEQKAFIQHQAPIQNLFEKHNTALLEKIEVFSPTHEYVPPERINLFITNNGGNSPSYIHRFVRELYHIDDYDL